MTTTAESTVQTGDPRNQRFLEKIEENRESLELLASRDDLPVSKWASCILAIADGEDDIAPHDPAGAHRGDSAR